MPAASNRTNTAAVDDTSRRRSFVDHEGAHWSVHEQAFADYDRRRGMSLIFSSDSAVRRVRDYPNNWAELTDAELLVLSWNA
jgi:hypothetical protein